MQRSGAEALVSLRADMLRFAQLQLRDRDAAEDLVQESIEAALRKSSRNRLIDHLRQACMMWAVGRSRRAGGAAGQPSTCAGPGDQG